MVGAFDSEPAFRAGAVHRGAESADQYGQRLFAQLNGKIVLDVLESNVNLIRTQRLSIRSFLLVKTHTGTTFELRYEIRRARGRPVDRNDGLHSFSVPRQIRNFHHVPESHRRVVPVACASVDSLGEEVCECLLFVCIV